MDHLTSDVFLKLFPQFTSAPEEWIDVLLNLCETAAFSQCLWGDFLQWGEALYVAHYLTIRYQNLGSWTFDPDDPLASAAWMQNAAMNDLSSFNAGSVSYAKNGAIQEAMMTNPFMRTQYGQELVALRKHLAVGLVMVT